MDKKEVFIIGAGLGGLSTAISLRAKGYKVTIYEKNYNSGGKMNVYKDKGFLFDIGPHIITLPQIIDDLFLSINKNPKDYFELIEIKPFNRYITKDSIFDISSNADENYKLVEKLFPCDIRNYSRLEKLSKNYYRLTNSQFQKYKKTNITEFYKLFQLFLYSPFESLSNKLNKILKTASLRDIYYSFCFYIGTDPKHTCSIYLMLDYLQKEFGVFYVKGGMYKLSQGLEKLARELGVKILFDSEVSNLKLEENKISSINVKHGIDQKIINLKNSILVSNMDFGFTHTLIEDYQKLSSVNREINQYYSLPQSTSAFIILLGLDNKIKELKHHNTFLSDDIINEFSEIYEKKQLSTDPTIGIDITTKSDDTVAPPGCDSLFIMASPSSSLKIAWNDIKNDYANQIIKKIETRLKINIHDHIIVKKIITPTDITEMYNQPYGSIYGQSAWGVKGLVSRKTNKSKFITNLYFAGGSVQPGGGIPMVISSGLTVSYLIDKNA